MVRSAIIHLFSLIREIDRKNIIYFSIFIIFNIAFTYSLYLKEKEAITNNIDNKLISVANSVKIILPENFHEIAINKDSISKEDDLINTKKLTRLAEEFGVEHVYTFIKEDDKLYLTSSSATETELIDGTQRKYFDRFNTNNKEILTSFMTNEDVFVKENKNKLGTFRSVFIQNKTESGKIYITGVDIRLDEIESDIRNNEIKSFLDFSYYFILIMSIIMPLFYILYVNIHKRANFDFLTGLPNKIEFNTKAEIALSLSKRKNDTLSILFLDLDGFKAVNDNFGHEYGDKLLKEVAHRITTSIRSSDIPSRQGGDEFIIALLNTDKDTSSVIAAKLVTEIGRPYIINKKEINIGVSIGIASYPSDDIKLKELCLKADIAMYKAKENGKNHYSHYEEK